ncbi:uncharacterized protein LOC121390658 [Gigantopelta aegis]|uniref:uncharacterized protein LOC121390658 n=1 Tax=Gigantopelta aegis TaxID=1735272 RepID=UPI001B88E059|nr:uncharacterized protein LOC121390658 [Gigantopelta aegis]
MNGPSLIFFSLLCLYLYTPESESIWCYQCGSVKDNQECQTDLNKLKSHGSNREGKYAKDCSRQFLNQNNSVQYYCLIETHRHTGGELLSFRRDCSDGVHFSYNIKNNSQRIRHLENLRPNNQSACATFEGEQICLRLCDTDFCNGPNFTCKVIIYDDGRENVTCGSIGQLYARYPTVFGTVIDGIVGNLLTAPFVMCLLLVLLLH